MPTKCLTQKQGCDALSYKLQSIKHAYDELGHWLQPMKHGCDAARC